MREAALENPHLRADAPVSDGAATELRELIAGIVMSDPDTYSEAFLGQPNEAYCAFIMNADRWGGAIEVARRA